MENNDLNQLVLDKLTKVCICKSINRAAIKKAIAVCICKSINRAAIKKAIAAGARTVIEVKKITGAGNGSCHGRRCTPKIQEILDSELAKLND